MQSPPCWAAPLLYARASSVLTASAAAGSASGSRSTAARSSSLKESSRPVRSRADVGDERGTAGGFGFLLLEALLVLQLPGALAFGVGRELVLDHGVGVRVVDAAGVGEQLHDARPLSDFGRASLIVGEVLAVAVHVLLQLCVLEGGRRLRVAHAAGTRADRAAAALAWSTGSRGAARWAGTRGRRWDRGAGVLTRASGKRTDRCVRCARGAADDTGL